MVEQKVKKPARIINWTNYIAKKKLELTFAKLTTSKFEPCLQVSVYV